MITKEQAIEAVETLDESCMYIGPAKTLRQYIEETADLRRQLAEAQEEIGTLRTRLVEKMDDCVKAEQKISEAKEAIAAQEVMISHLSETAKGANAAMINYRAEALEAQDRLAEAQSRLAELDGQEPVGVFLTQHEFLRTDGRNKVLWTYREVPWGKSIYANPAPSPADQKDAARVPDGWKLVPIKPTLAMIDAGAEVDPERASVWDSMLAAAPDAAMLSASQGGKCGELLDGEDSPFPGMASAFESYYGQSWKDRDWRRETSIWSAAWKAALSVTPPDSHAHRAAKVLMEAMEKVGLELGIDGLLPEWEFVDEALATAKQTMEGGE